MFQTIRTVFRCLTMNQYGHWMNQIDFQNETRIHRALRNLRNLIHWTREMKNQPETKIRTGWKSWRNFLIDRWIPSHS
jgi:hypothetical protein